MSLVLVRVPGSEGIKIVGAESNEGVVTLPAASGTFKVENQSDGWSISLRYRRAGSGLALTVEAKPVAMVYVNDEPRGKSATLKVSKSDISKFVFKPTSGAGEFSLMAKYTP